METPDYGAGLTDQETIGRRTAIVNSLGLLMRGWWLGMVTAHDEDDEEILDAIGSTIQLPPASPTTKVPIGMRFPKLRSGSRRDEFDAEGHKPLDDEEFLRVFNDLMHRAWLLHTAYDRGMFVAVTDEQHEYLNEVRSELGH